MSLDDIALVRCLVCNRVIEREWFEIHMSEECDGVPLYEEVER